MDDLKRLERVQKMFDYSFKSPQLVYLALSHASVRKKKGHCNERLEFLGDAVLGMVITDMLYRSHPDMNEGELTRLKGNLVSRRTLSILARDLNLGPLIEVGHGLPRSYPDSLLANVFEALIGAWYLDSGLTKVKKWLVDLFESRVTMIMNNRHEKNYKSILQQFSQKVWRCDPHYRCLKEMGPAHKKQFCYLVELSDDLHFEGEGTSRKQAQQKAAAAALRSLKRKVAYKNLLTQISG